MLEFIETSARSEAPVGELARQRAAVESLFAAFVEAHLVSGEPPSAAELCGDAPELLGPLEELIEQYRRVDRALALTGAREQATLPPGAQVGRYRVLGILGAGGMGIVYRAEDPMLGRHVALKLLPSATASEPRAKERFLREARAVSALDHPNICTIYEAGQSAEGQLFLAMACYEGETLAARLERGPLRAREALSLVLQVAEGLAWAHGRGIVHRDLKPGNLLITTDGVVKILDFGLAKRSGQNDLTETGARLGTAPYMAPEQVRGEPLDPRSDVWACGVLLHTMVTGRLPFAGDTPEALLFNIVHGAPRGLDELPDALRSVVARALAKAPAARFAGGGELLEALRATQRQLDGASGGGVAPPLATPPASAGRHRALAVVLATLALLAAAALAYRALPWPSRPAVRSPTAAALPSLAVLPFESLGPPEQQHFADGMTEAITTHLAKIEALKVIARSAVQRYQRDRPPPSVVARELGVEHLVEGSALLAGDRVRVTARLVEAASDRQVWAESYEGELRDVLALQSRVARAIAHEVQARVTPEEARRLVVERRVAPAAYAAFLEGRFHVAHAMALDGDTVGSLRAAIERLGAAAAAEPEWAEAHGALAHAQGLLASFSDDHQERLFHYRLARESAERAVELDPALAEARRVLGSIRLRADWDWEGAERELREAHRLLPNSADWAYGTFLVYAGRFEEAVAALRHAQERHPTSTLLRYQIGEALFYGGDLPAAAREAELLRSGLGDVVHAVLLEAQIAIARGQVAAAVELLLGHEAALRVNRRTTYLQTLSYAAAKAGDEALARRAIAELEALGTRAPPGALLALGDPEAARRGIEERYHEREYTLVRARLWPEYDNLRRLPGVAEIFEAAAAPLRGLPPRPHPLEGSGDADP
jgi:eukaryotic-like serine/threonine-protein kinase